MATPAKTPINSNARKKLCINTTVGVSYPKEINYRLV